MAETAELIRAMASVCWVILGLVALLALRSAITDPSRSLSRLGIGPTGISMEVAERKLDEASRAQAAGGSTTIGEAAKKGVLLRLERNADILRGARVLWADDHPTNNLPVVELLRSAGARVETPTSNAGAMALLSASRYDPVITDVARDDEGPLAGVDLAEEVNQRFGLRAVLFTARFDRMRLPGTSDSDRLVLARRVRDATTGITNRFDEVLHLAVDVLERSRV